MPKDHELVQDLCSIKRTITSMGNVRYDAEHNARGHADRAWALALAIHACTHRVSGMNRLLMTHH
jgi:phage FluMu gp28-like protein